MMKRASLIRLTAAVGLLVGNVAAVHAAPEHKTSDEANEVAFLIAQGTADSLATAALLTHLIQSPDGARPRAARLDPGQLIRRATALAPGRPELIWLELRDCQIVRCPEESNIAARLRAADPDNGLVRLSDLRTASGEEATKAVRQIGESHKPQLYWNRLAVMMYDALTHRAGQVPPTAISRDPDDRLSHVTGVLAALDVPPFQPLAHACGTEQFEEPGRQEACSLAAAALDKSDTVIAQNVGFSLRQNLLPAGGGAREALQSDHLQQRYMTVQSNRVRENQVDKDAGMRVAAMRRLPREQDVEAAMLTAFGEPLTRPPDWTVPEVKQ